MTMARIVLIHPRFEHSYWGLEYALPIVGKKANVPVAALPLLAAVTPNNHDIRIIDEAVESINYEELMNADIVGLTGMSVQRFRMKEILIELKRRELFTVVGGAWVTVQEEYFEGLADAIFVGEAEETWPAFLEDWENQKWKSRYEQINKTDMTKVPVPRYDLLDMKSYFSGSLQISRGCPFLCEFCDIIVTFGRRPRLKTSSQVRSELDALRTHGMRSVFIVDDNLIGNKQAIKPILREIVAYQQAYKFPFRFFTEATLDLAEDEELLMLMAQANIDAVFIGIESPNEEALKETRKYQNIRPSAGTMLERINRIQKAGLEVYAGMIVGFDNDDPSIFAAQKAFIEQSSIVEVMLGMLYALPKTPLHARLMQERRLDLEDKSPFGTNVIPVRMTRQELTSGYVKTMREIHESASFFGRVDHLYLDKIVDKQGLGSTIYLKGHPVFALKMNFRYLIGCALLFLRLMRHVESQPLRCEYRLRIWRFIRACPEPLMILKYIAKCAFHYHAYRLTENLREGRMVSTM